MCTSDGVRQVRSVLTASVLWARGGPGSIEPWTLEELLRDKSMPDADDSGKEDKGGRV